jgi:hypothetical protein
MKPGIWCRAATCLTGASILCCWLMCLFFFAPVVRPATSGSASPVRTPKCTIDIASTEASSCTLVKAKDEWILWSNSASSHRSIHFKSDNSPFTEMNCWDVDPGARARSGPVILNAALKTYVGYTSSVPCGSNPPSEAGSGTIEVIVQ